MTPSRKADWIRIDEARDSILANLPTSPPTEICSLEDAEGRVLAEDLVSPLDLPPWDNSAMDGFAVRGADVIGASDGAPRQLLVVGDVPAGAFPDRQLSANEAMRVMTGAPIPGGADSVIRVEHTDAGSRSGPGGTVAIQSDLDVGRNVRQKGEDIRRGAVALARGTVLRPAEIGVAAALGHARLRVARPPRVALLTSGDELVDIDRFEEVLGGHRIVSSNSYSIAAQIREAGGTAVDLGIASDSPESIRSSLSAAAGCDALVTIAGMSVGEHDHMIRMLTELDTEIAFWRVRIRPGSPFAFGRIHAFGGIPWFGLPGNPVSAVVTFELLVRPALLRLAGARSIFSPVVSVRITEAIDGSEGLTRFHRVRLEPAERGEPPRARLTGRQGSNLLSSMVGADALLVVRADRGSVRAGEVLPAILFGGRPLGTDPGYEP
jgi:molybdopterin molybdotransferase